MAGIFRQKNAFLRCCKTSAHHEHILAGKEFAVACGTIGHAAPAKLLLPGKAHRTRMRPSSQQHAEAFQHAPAGVHSFYIAVHPQALYLGQKKFRAKALRLLPHGFCQGRPAGTRHTGVIHHFGRNGNLPAEVLFFHHNNAIAGAGEIQRRRQPRRAAAHDDGVIQFLPFHNA